jgi:acyl-coenzyme A synthetase/AMP-(fatty) acid ligase
MFNPNTNDIVAVYAGSIGAEELGKILSKKLPHYMLPTRYEKLSAMPMNLNGKIDRVKLKSLYGKGC